MTAWDDYMLRIKQRPHIHPGDAALAAVVVAIAVYDALAPKDETISEAVDRHLAAQHWLTEILAALVYVHVSNKLPPYADPIHIVFTTIRRFTRRATWRASSR